VAKSNFTVPRITKQVLIPPWKTLAEWQEFHHTLSLTISTRAADLKRARSLALGIQEQLLTTSDVMERLGAQTCIHCPTICCLSAKIWADFKDAIFWHLSSQAVPLQQTIPHINQVCRYLGSRGCTLPRLSRPFVCTWYCCPTQVLHMQTRPQSGDWADLRDTLQSIKHNRQKLENTFVKAVS